MDVVAHWQPPLTHTATVLCEVDGGAEPAEGPNRADFALRPDYGLCVHDGASWYGFSMLPSPMDTFVMRGGLDYIAVKGGAPPGYQ